MDWLGRAVPGAGLVRLDRGIGQQLGRGAQDACAFAVEHDRAVHLGELAQSGAGELDGQWEPAGRHGFHDFVVAKHDERTGAPTQDPLQSVPQLGPWRHCRQGGAQQVVVASFHVFAPLGLFGLVRSVAALVRCVAGSGRSGWRSLTVRAALARLVTDP